MKLLKVILLIFLIYFIRRFYQLYKRAKEIQAANNTSDNPNGPVSKNQKDVIEADYKVVK